MHYFSFPRHDGPLQGQGAVYLQGRPADRSAPLGNACRRGRKLPCRAEWPRLIGTLSTMFTRTGRKSTEMTATLTKSFAALDRIAREEATLAKLDSAKLDACIAKQDETQVRASAKEAEASGHRWNSGALCGRRTHQRRCSRGTGVAGNRPRPARGRRRTTAGTRPTCAPGMERASKQREFPPRLSFQDGGTRRTEAGCESVDIAEPGLRDLSLNAGNGRLPRRYRLQVQASSFQHRCVAFALVLSCTPFAGCTGRMQARSFARRDGDGQRQGHPSL